MSQSRRLPAAALALAATFGTAHATGANDPATHSLYTGVQFGAHRFDSDAGIDDATDATATLAFRFSDSLSGELAAGRTATRTDTGADIDVDTVHVDGLWHYARGVTWQRYLVGGVGQQSVGVTGTDHNSTFLTGGWGVFRSIGRPFLLRVEGRWLYDLDEEQLGLRVSLGLAAAFGGDR